MPTSAAFLLRALAAHAIRRSLLAGGGCAGRSLPAPIGACPIPPLTWPAIARTAAAAPKLRSAWPHVAVSAGAALLAAGAPALLDAASATDGTAILDHLRGRPDAVPVGRLGAGERPASLGSSPERN